MKKKLLSLDGGGVLGVGQACILAQANTDKFDYLAGTSVGSVIAGVLASGGDKAMLTDFFFEYAPRIFAGRWWRRMNVFTTPKYDDKQLNAALKAMLPGKFGDLDRQTFVVAADLSRRRAKIFCSTDPEDGQWDLWQVVRCSVAAETYFEPWLGYADGGIYANNPVMAGIAGIHARNPHVTLEDLQVCSIGTGRVIENTTVGTTRGWSYIKWGSFIIQTMLNGAASGMHAYFARSLYLDKYKRIEFDSKREWRFDDPTIVQDIVDTWQPAIQAGIVDVNNF